MTTTTSRRRFVGQNIKGTPKMPARDVRHDLRALTDNADVYGLQEFKWRTYWAALTAHAGPRRPWASYPSLVRGLARPIRGAQAIGWRRSLWRAVDHRDRLLHQGRAGISDDRWLRAVLLEDKATGLRAWHGSTHFVVGGDRPRSPRIRRDILAADLRHLDAFLTELKQTGDPVIFELDANIHYGSSDAYKQFRGLIAAHGGDFHGGLGIEYLFTIPGEHTHIAIDDVWTIPVTRLFTDHEGRGITYRIVRP